MNVELRHDVVTGVWTAHPDLHGKAFPKAARTVPEAANCPFCPLTTARGGDTVTDGPHQRVVIAANDAALVVENRWGPFGPHYAAELVILRTHLVSLEDTDVVTVREFLTLWAARAHALRTPATRLLAMMNVGVTAGSSQPHTHAQVIVAPRTSPPPVRVRTDPATLNVDATLARRHGMVLTERGGVAYVAYAPSAPGEIRVQAPFVGALAEPLHRVLRALTAVAGELSYNLLLHVGPRPFVQVLPRFSFVGLTKDYLALTTNTVPLDTYAHDLRAAITSRAA